ncbi:hypothetical protein [Candidatus Kuenenia sp.]|uniref:hypothetical protein n=1 Tax=Candidatus Kuenenia sp. TaxID=2499824 RepID=UPI00321F7EB9
MFDSTTLRHKLETSTWAHLHDIFRQQEFASLPPENHRKYIRALEEVHGDPRLKELFRQALRSTQAYVNAVSEKINKAIYPSEYEDPPEDCKENS